VTRAALGRVVTLRGDAPARWNLFVPRDAVRAYAPQPISPLVAAVLSRHPRVNAVTEAPLRATTRPYARARDARASVPAQGDHAIP